MNTFKTPKGTELPFLNLKGKDYLQIAHRLVWFREDHPDWQIVTQIVSTSNEESLVQASIRDADGVVLATAHKQQSAKGFAAHLEKAESGAIGRALAFLGYGTAHAQELEEDDHTPPEQLSDSPLPSKQKNAEYVIPFGKFKGKTLKQVSMVELHEYVQYIIKKAEEDKKPINGPVKEFIERVEAQDGKIPF